MMNSSNKKKEANDATTLVSVSVTADVINNEQLDLSEKSIYLETGSFFSINPFFNLFRNTILDNDQRTTNLELKKENQLQLSIEEKAELHNASISDIETLAETVQNNNFAYLNNPLFVVSQTSEAVTSNKLTTDIAEEAGIDEIDQTYGSEINDNTANQESEEPSSLELIDNGTVENILVTGAEINVDAPVNQNNFPLVMETCDIEPYSEDWEVMIGEIMSSFEIDYETIIFELEENYDGNICAYYDDLFGSS